MGQDEAINKFMEQQVPTDELDYKLKTIDKRPHTDEELDDLYLRLRCTYLLQLALVG